MKPESDCGNTREGGCARLESGTAFMPGVSEKRLEKAARREKDKCAKFRLLACLGRKKRHDPQLRIGPSMPIILQMCAPKHATFV